MSIQKQKRESKLTCNSIIRVKDTQAVTHSFTVRYKKMDGEMDMLDKMGGWGGASDDKRPKTGTRE